MRPFNAIISCFTLISFIIPASSLAKNSPNNLTTTLPKISSFTAKRIPKTCAQTIDSTKNKIAAIEAIPHEKRSFTNTVEAASHALADYELTINTIYLIKSVSPNKQVRDAGQKCIVKADQFASVDLFTREKLYQAFKEYDNKKPKLNYSQNKLLKDYLIAFRKNGLMLPTNERQEVIKLKKELIKKTSAYRKNLSEYKDHLTVSKAELDGMSASYIEGLERNSDGTYKVTMAYPHFYPFMRTATNANARKQLQFKFYNRAAKTNVKLLEEILTLRDSIARKLGYKTHAHYVLEDRMAKKPKTVEKFLNKLLKKLRKQTKTDMAEMLSFKRKTYPATTKVHDWDWRFYRSEIKKARYKIDAQKVKEYFPLKTVTAGLFDIYQSLFDVTFKEVPTKNKWHKDVKLYTVSDNKSQELLGHFYLDLFPRDGKYGHAAAFGLIDGRVMPDGSYRTPLNVMVANFTKPTKNSPALLGHNEVTTFFHEFGHVMHLLLSKPVYAQQSGYGVAWDFVEAPSQMLENWAWQPKVLKTISAHYKTGESLPDEMIKNMIDAKYLHVGVSYSRQILYGLMNHYFHTRQNVDTTALINELWKDIALTDSQAGTHMQASFGHLINYDAAYYTYLWSEVFSADMFSRFEKEGPLNKATGYAYRKAVLEPGASKDEMELLKDFLGRKPNQRAFLKSIGLK